MMADSPQRPRPAARDDDAPLRLPVLLYIPNLICYVRLVLSLYGLSIVAHTVTRKQTDAAHDGSGCSVQAMMQTASFYAKQISNAGLLPPVAYTLLGKGMEHLSATTLRGDSNNRKDNDGIELFLEPDLTAAVLVYVVAAALDVLDGYVARRLNQTSLLGELLDVIADNILRSCMWVSSALLDSRQAVPCLVILSIEWITLLASQLLAQRDGGRHWKKQRSADPWLVRYFFSNNFRNILGVWGISSLFFLPLYPLLLQAFPAIGRMGGATVQGGQGWKLGTTVVRGVGYMLGGGRVLSLGIELNFVKGLVDVLVEEEEEGRKGGKTGDGGLRERHKAT